MCKWGTDVILPVTMPAHLSHTGEARVAEKGIDACIAPIVKALNDAGILTIQSCCGHGKQDGEIALADGRVLLVCPSRESADGARALPLVNEETISEASARFAIAANRRRGIRAVMKYTLEIARTFTEGTR